jgi:cytochrome c-type biogenesis protein CcmH/NrfG
MFALIGGGVFAVRNALQEEWRREAFLPELEERVRQDPADARSLALLAARMAEAKEYTTATAICEKAVGAGIREPALWLTWASCFAAANDLNKARAVLQLAVGSGKCQPSGPAREALSRLQAPLAEAERTGQTSDPTAIASVISPDGIRPLVALYASGSFLNPVMNYRQKSDPERGGFSSRQRQALAKPDDPLAQARWVQALSKNRRLPEAETESRRLVTRFPDSPEIRLAYGDALFQGKIFAKAGLQYKAALSLRPDWLPALKGLGAVAVEKSLFRLAIENYEKAVKFAPNDVDAWIGLGRAHLQQAFRMDRALESFRNAERLAPNRTDFYPYYADALTFTYHADEAETILRRRLAAAPEDARSRYLLANIILNGKADNARIAEAEEHLRTSLKIEPNVPVVKIRLAQLLLDRADASSAADAGILLVEALEGDPRNILAVRLLAQAYQRIGKIDKAKETREQADQLAKYITEVSRLEDLERNRPDDISVHRALRDLYTRNDEPDKAKRQEEMIYMLENHPEAAKRGLSTLMEAATKTGQVSGETKPPGMNAP